MYRNVLSCVFYREQDWCDAQTSVVRQIYIGVENNINSYWQSYCCTTRNEKSWLKTKFGKNTFEYHVLLACMHIQNLNVDFPDSVLNQCCAMVVQTCWPTKSLPVQPLRPQGQYLFLHLSESTVLRSLYVCGRSTHCWRGCGQGKGQMRGEMEQRGKRNSKRLNAYKWIF